MMKHLFYTVLISLAAFSPGFAESLEDRLFTVQRDGRESGSGFLLKETNNVWMVSNYHVVRGDADIQFVGMVDKTRSYALPKTVEIAADRDAVRFAVAETGGFPTADDCSFDDEVLAFGNSGGAGVVTKSKGTVVGKGRGEIEVTCEIIPGNSGGPVLNSSNEVIGIATFIIKAPAAAVSAELVGTLPDAERERLVEKMKETHGTRYENTRRFAVPLEATEWQQVELDTFKNESKAFEQIDDRFDRFNKAVSLVYQAKLLPADDDNLFAQGWVRNYNSGLREYGYYNSSSGRFYISAGRKESFYRAYGRWLKALSGTAERLSTEFCEATNELTVLYFQKEIGERAEKLNRTSSELLKSAEKYKL